MGGPFLCVQWIFLPILFPLLYLHYRCLHGKDKTVKYVLFKSVTKKNCILIKYVDGHRCKEYDDCVLNDLDLKKSKMEYWLQLESIYKFRSSEDSLQVRIISFQCTS